MSGINSRENDTEGRSEVAERNGAALPPSASLSPRKHNSATNKKGEGGLRAQDVVLVEVAEKQARVKYQR